MLIEHRGRATAVMLLTLSGAVAASLTACGQREAPAAPEARLVRTLVVSDASDAQLSQYTAEIRSRIEADLGFQVSGKVKRRAVDVGALVKRGDVLAALDSTDYQLGVDAARSAMNAAQAELDRARSEEARYRDLLERGLTTRATYVAQQTAVTTSQSRLEQANSDLRLNEQRLSYTTLRADQDGVVTRVMAEVGTVVAAGQPVMSIARPDELEAVFDVPDGRIDALRGNPQLGVQFLGESADAFPARVREISPSADPVTRTYQVRASIPEPPDRLRLGMTVTVTLSSGDGTANVRLPATALFQSGSDSAVWVVRGDMTLELRTVQVGRYESDSVFVTTGLDTGDRVVTAGVHRLAEGEAVRLLDEVRP